MTTSIASPRSRIRELTVVSNVERLDRTTRQVIFQTNQLPIVHEVSRTGTMRAMLEWPVLEQLLLLLLLNEARLPITGGRATVQ